MPGRRMRSMLPRGGMEAVGGHHVSPDPRHQRREHPHTLAAPVDERRGRDLRAHAGQDLVLSIQGKMIVELGDEDVCWMSLRTDPAAIGNVTEN